MDFELLRRLSNAFGPPGQEEEPREILRAELEEFADEVNVDVMGNIFFHHRGEGAYPKIMLDAHTDEVAFITTHVDDRGFLRFSTLGGIPANIMPGQRITMKGRKGFLRGIVGTKPPQVMKEGEQMKPVSVEELFIDVGAESGEAAFEKGCHVGMTGVFDVEFTELGGGYLRGKAFDCRAGCAVMAWAFKALNDSPYNVVAVGAVQEEVGLRGARTAAWQVEPDFALALEGTFAVDVPGSRPEHTVSSLKGGPVLTIADRYLITHPRVLQTLTEAAEAEAIPYQFKKPTMGGTDAGAIHLTKKGVPSGVVSVPCRYIHGPASIAHMDDLRNATKLVEAFVRNVSKPIR